MDEFALIAKYFNWENTDSSITTSVGDDCAVFHCEQGFELVTSVDTLIEDVHFFATDNAKDIAHKALAVNLSDLAAMGATPKYFTLALTLPAINHKWLEEFSASLKHIANKYKISLIGGDTTKGKLSITINVVGANSKGKSLLRSGAKVGDGIFVSGMLGDAAYALKQLQQNNVVNASSIARLNKPTPRIALGLELINIANSCIDISDGLQQDLAHLLQASNVGAIIDINKIPLSSAVASYIKKTNDWSVAIAGGDDYELCFSVAQKHLPQIALIAKKINLQLTQIGTITPDKQLIIKPNFTKNYQSYAHF